MIEEIKLLLPLLTDAGTAASWLLFAYIVKDVAQTVIIMGAILLLVRILARAVVTSRSMEQQLSPLQVAQAATRSAWLHANTAARSTELYKVFQTLEAMKDEKQ